nr:hypothetical protein [Tanacetum cinerariifolium]
RQLVEVFAGAAKAAAIRRVFVWLRTAAYKEMFVLDARSGSSGTREMFVLAARSGSSSTREMFVLAARSGSSSTRGMFVLVA